MSRIGRNKRKEEVVSVRRKKWGKENGNWSLEEGERSRTKLLLEEKMNEKVRERC